MAKKTKTLYQKLVGWVIDSKWSFPIILLLPLLLATAFGVHGSSVGIYDNLINGSSADNPSLLYGKPRAIRSDEWKVWTPTTISQVNNDFDEFNESLGSGRDVSLKPDAPTKSWETVFRPHNWSFLVMPLENAFAFRWWIMLYLLIVATYFLILKLLPENRFVAIVLSLVFALSPFILWWYQSGLLLCFAYAMLASLLIFSLLDHKRTLSAKSIVHTTLTLVGIAYLGVAFGLLTYVPFLLPTGLVSLGLVAGYTLNKLQSRSIRMKDLLISVGLLALPVMAVAGFGALYFSDNSTVVSAMSASEYPGARRVDSGDDYRRIYYIFASFLQPLLQIDSRGLNYINNQSESSTFILVAPYILAISVAMQLALYRKTRQVDWILTLMNILFTLFLVRMFFPVGNWFYGLIFLDRVPHNRLIAGVGLSGFIQTVLTAKMVVQNKDTVTKRTVLICMSICVLVALAVGVSAMNKYPSFLTSTPLMLVLVLLFCPLIYLLITGRIRLWALYFLGYTMLSSIAIMPIYRGMGIFSQDSQLSHAIRSVSTKSDSWVVLDDMNFQNIPFAFGRNTIGGTQIYTDLNFWRELDQTGQYTEVYNRQAHAIFISNTKDDDVNAKYNMTSINAPLELVKENVFKVRFDCSVDFITNHVDFVLSTSPVDSIECLRLIDTIDNPKKDFYIYKMKN